MLLFIGGPGLVVLCRRAARRGCNRRCRAEGVGAGGGPVARPLVGRRVRPGEAGRLDLVQKVLTAIGSDLNRSFDTGPESQSRELV